MGDRRHHRRQDQLGGALPHAHGREEEAFYVLSGDFGFVNGDKIIEAGPGDLFFVSTSEVFALEDHVAVGRGERPAGLGVVLDEAVAALPLGVPYEAPPRIDRVQLV
ncbi:cupin domain-containing protein [Streptomyces sp. NPDC056921]|uniref:cupin domain-containing protein n=1 Tax=Streptomyces sp. NPDC056921 TaxID=3345966 RepID=UPI00363E5CAE